jgi:hypothetical protein
MLFLTAFILIYLKGPALSNGKFCPGKATNDGILVLLNIPNKTYVRTYQNVRYYIRENLLREMERVTREQSCAIRIRNK